MRFHEEARSNQCFIISACGFDSVPADLGTCLVQQKFKLPSSVEAFLNIKTSASGIRELLNMTVLTIQEMYPPPIIIFTQDLRGTPSKYLDHLGILASQAAILCTEELAH